MHPHNVNGDKFTETFSRPYNVSQEKLQRASYVLKISSDRIF